jgi:hypothetical protein
MYGPSVEHEIILRIIQVSINDRSPIVGSHTPNSPYLACFPFTLNHVSFAASGRLNGCASVLNTH